MNHLPLNLPPTDTIFYSPMDHRHPFFYSNYHHHHNNQNDDDSDNSSSNNLNSAANNHNDNRSETTSSHNPHSQALDHHEHMFEKPLTPSDVGKLNRLVIPKQHAEKYFPLAGVSSNSAATTSSSSTAAVDGGGGLLLGFEDESGKCWRFRYSYWNSSQSYVLTKGWSRYVKEKKLDAGDVVLFERHRFEPDRFFIGWRRRRGSVPVHPPVRPVDDFAGGTAWPTSGQGQRYNNDAVMQVHQQQVYALPHRINSFPYHHHHHHQQHQHHQQQTDYFHAAGTGVRQQSQKAGPRSGASKKLRLFGVNLECQLEEGATADDIDTEPQTSDGSSLSSQGPVHGLGFGSASGSAVGPTPYIYVGYPLNHHDHMDMNFPQDVNQMRNRLG